jgi:hypothetical protein
MPKTARPPKRMFRNREDRQGAFSALMEQAHLADAEGSWEQAWGRWEQAQVRWREARRLMRQALTIDPKSIPARVDFAGMLGSHPESLDDIHESLRLSREILRDLPGCVNAHLILSSAHYRLGNYSEHERHFSLGFRHLPEESKNYAGVRLERAGHWLETGDYGRGWPEYDYWMNRKAARRDRLALTSPWWSGEDLADKTILLHNMDGFGDAIQFIRYAPMVKARGGIVILSCQSSLAYLLAECDGLDRVIVEGAEVPAELARHDFHCPLMSLPAILKTTLGTVPAKVPYLAASSEAIEKWKPVVESIPGYRIGIAHQGAIGHENDLFRSFPLKEFAPLAGVPGVSLVSLQKGPAVEQIADAGFCLVDLGEGYQAGDWMDTAAIVSQLDLIISPDTSIAHLAGALAQPTWIALPTPAEWRWMRERNDSPWYPTMELFRQATPGDWPSVFDRMADTLRDRVAASP